MMMLLTVAPIATKWPTFAPHLTIIIHTIIGCQVRNIIYIQICHLNHLIFRILQQPATRSRCYASSGFNACFLLRLSDQICQLLSFLPLSSVFFFFFLLLSSSSFSSLTDSIDDKRKFFSLTRSLALARALSLPFALRLAGLTSKKRCFQANCGRKTFSLPFFFLFFFSLFLFFLFLLFFLSSLSHSHPALSS